MGVVAGGDGFVTLPQQSAHILLQHPLSEHLMYLHMFAYSQMGSCCVYIDSSFEDLTVLSLYNIVLSSACKCLTRACDAQQHQSADDKDEGVSMGGSKL